MSVQRETSTLVRRDFRVSTEPLPTTYVVDDNEHLCQVLERLLAQNGLRCETYNSAESFLEHCTPTAPGCIVLDIKMGGMNGLELQSRLKETGCELPIVILTAHAEVDKVLQAWKSGSYDFLLKPVGNQELLEKVQRALRYSQAEYEKRMELASILERIESLTPREHEVMGMVVSGKANKAVGAALGLAQKTVEVHRANVMRKMRASSLAELVTMVLTARGQRPEEDPPRGH